MKKNVFRTQAEVHFVHFKKEYKTIGDSLKKADGLLVVGFFVNFNARRAPKTTSVSRTSSK